MSAGNDPELDAIFSDVPADTPPPDAAETPADVESAAEKTEPATTQPAQPERPRGPKKPWWDIYTSMLALTLLAILFGCIFLVMEWSRYNFETTPPAIPAAGGNAGGG